MTATDHLSEVLERTESPGSGDVRRGWSNRVGLDRFSALYLLAFFFIVFGLLQPNTFLTHTTAALVLSQGVIIAVLAIAFLVPLTAGQFDLSIGAMMAFALVIENWIGIHSRIPPVAGAAIAIFACAGVGCISGFVVVKLRVSSFIATLGMSQVLTAGALLISGNLEITGAFSQGYLNWGQREIIGIPILVLYLLGLAIAVWYLLEHTTTGRHLFATGGNLEAARLAGVPTDRLIWLSLVLSGVIAGFAGTLYCISIGTFDTNVGPGYLFPAVTAVFFGASQFSRRPNVWGTLLALYALSFGVQGLELEFSSGAFWISPLFQGLALIAAVALASREGNLRIRVRTRTSEGAVSDDIEEEAAPQSSTGGS